MIRTIKNVLFVIAILSTFWGCESAKKQDFPIQSAALSDVTILPGFWGERLASNRNVTIPHAFSQCESHGLIDNFAIAAGLKTGEQGGIYPFDDTDVYKTIEGASYWLTQSDDPELDAYVDSLIGLIGAAQEPDGYIYTALKNKPDWLTRRSGDKRWANLAFGHELYNFGHMYEAAAAHYWATGKRNFLDIAIKNADLVVKTFGPNGIEHPPGHQEIEIGLAKLYRITGAQKYLDLAKYFLDQRGVFANDRKSMGEYAQDHQPVLAQEEAVGHAVRQAYMNMAMLEIAALTGDSRYLEKSRKLWNNVVQQKLYITGGLGAVGFGERFGRAYELPNFSAYQETCTAIANVMWNFRLFQSTGDAQYLDVLEKSLYNTLLAGVSLHGDHFFYPNVLASKGYHERFEWMVCNCCITNMSRFMPALGQYVYGTNGASAFVNLFVNSTATLLVGDESLKLSQHSDYPFEGKVRISVEYAPTAPVALHIRIPGWAQNVALPGGLYQFAKNDSSPVTLALNGELIDTKLDNGFAVIERQWSGGEVLELNLPMPVRTVLASEQLTENAGKLALQRGPLIYSLEGVDQPDGKVLDKLLPENATFSVERRDDLPGDVTAIRFTGQLVTMGANGKLDASQPVDLTAIPYFAWAHRGMSEMAVWLPVVPEKTFPKGAPTMSRLAKIVFEGDASGIAALNDAHQPTSSRDAENGYFAWAERRDTLRVTYEFDMPRAFSASQIYWFLDVAKNYQVPEKWRVQLLVEGEWHTVFNPYTVWENAPDQFNKVIYETVTADAARLEVFPKSGATAAILEWRID